MNKDYKILKHKSIDSNKKENYLLKPRFNESPAHCFYIHDIANYLKKYSDKISTFETTKPDIVFEINGKNIAVEVETGKTYLHKKEMLKKKIELLNKNYDDWFFVVISKQFMAKYRKFGKVLDLRNFKKHLDSFIKKL